MRLLIFAKTALLLYMIALVFHFPVEAQELLAPAATEQPVADRAALLARLPLLEAEARAAGMRPDARIPYAETLSSVGYHDLAAREYEALAVDFSDQPDYWLAAADAWMRVGPSGREPAFDALNHLLSMDEDHIEAHALLARLLHREGLYALAEDAYEKTLQLQQEHVGAVIGLAVLRVRAGDIVESSAQIDALGVKAQPFDVETRLMLRKALFDFEHCGGWLDDTAPNHAAYARLLYRAGRITDALLVSRRSVSLDPAQFETWNFLAAMQLQLGNVERAVEAYAKSLEANANQPNIAEARKQLINQMTLEQRNKTP